MQPTLYRTKLHIHYNTLQSTEKQCNVLNIASGIVLDKFALHSPMENMTYCQQSLPYNEESKILGINPKFKPCISFLSLTMYTLP